MKTLLALAAALLVGLAGQARAEAAPAASVPTASPAVLAGSAQFDMVSKVSGRSYRIYVWKPLLPPPPGGYPVLTVTDGSGLFPTASLEMLLRETNELRPAVIVGVGYPVADQMQMLSLRNRDLTPFTPADKIPSAMKAGATDTQLLAQYGGAEDFYRFLVEELRPTIAAMLPTDAHDQSLFGDSLGGLFALHVMFNHPEAFRTYLAGSPSIWWNDRAVLKDEARFSAEVARGKVAPRLFVSVGGYEQSLQGLNLPASLPVEARAKLAKSMAESRMIDNARELADRLAALKGAAGYEVQFQVFPDETHSSVIPGALSRAMGFALRP